MSRDDMPSLILVTMQILLLCIYIYILSGLSVLNNVKNKICTDCDLIALLEDDTGMVSKTLVERSSPVFIMYFNLIL